MARRLGLGIGTGKAKASATRYEKTPEIGPFVNPNAPKHYTDNSYEDMYRWRAPQPERDKYTDLGNQPKFQSNYGSDVHVNPYKGSDNFQWFGGERRPKTQQEYDVEYQAKWNRLQANKQTEWQNWEIGEARKQAEKEAADAQAQLDELMRQYYKQRKEMARQMEAQRIAAQNQMAAAKGKGNKATRPETGAYEGEPSERRGGGDDGGASGTLLTRPGEKPTLGKRGSLGSKTLLGG